MEGSKEELVKIIRDLLKVREETTEEVLKNATPKELAEYIKVSEEIEAKLKMLLK